MALAGAAVLGHAFPVYLKFKGGKGVATSAGALFALAKFSTVGAILIFLLVVALWRLFPWDQLSRPPVSLFFTF